MTADQVNIAAATLLGWKVDDEEEDGAIMCHRPLEGYSQPVWDMLPDFTKSSDAALLLAEHLREKGFSPKIEALEDWYVEWRQEVSPGCWRCITSIRSKSFAVALTTACLRAANVWKD